MIPPKINEIVTDPDGTKWEIVSVTPVFTKFKKSNQATKIERYALGLRRL